MAFASVTFRGSTLPEKKPIAYHGNPQDFRRSKTRQKAKAYVAQQVTLGQTPLSSPDAVFYTDGSALLASRTAEWVVYLNRACAFPVSLWGPVVTGQSEPDWRGALRPTNKTGEISAFCHAHKWIRASDGTSSINSPTSQFDRRLRVLLAPRRGQLHQGPMK